MGSPANHVLADFCIVPIGIGTSISDYVAECQRLMAAAGLKTKLHAFGTNVEGNWDDVMLAIKTCHDALHKMGAQRLLTTLKLSTRTDREQSIAEKIAAVSNKLL